MLILTDQILSNYTTIQIGGCVQYMLFPTIDIEVSEAIIWAKKQGLPFLFLAGGSNTVFPDQGLLYSQVIINLTKFNAVDLQIDPADNSSDRIKIIAKSGASLQRLVDLSLNNNFGFQSGLMVGLNRIPGTIGGATVGNAGAYGTEIKDIVESVKCLSLNDFSNLILSSTECRFGYRDSIFKQNKDLIILEVTLSLPITKNFEEDKVRYDEIANKRDVVYPVGFASPGSLFKNILFDSLSPAVKSKIPKEWIVYGNKLPVGKLLESLNCQGFSIGGIQMRPTHSNIMVNFNKGSYQNAIDIVQDLKLRVYNQYEIIIEPEVRFISSNFNDFYK